MGCNQSNTVQTELGIAPDDFVPVSFFHHDSGKYAVIPCCFILIAIAAK
jgi:hypothetical protein